MVARVFILLTALFSLGCSGTPKAPSRNVAGVQTGFSKHEFSFGGEKYAYSVFVPDSFNPKQRYPAVLFLHGMFEGGTNNTKQTGTGIGPALPKMSQKYPMIVVFPQTRGDWRTKSTHPLALATLDDAMRRLPIDASRVTLCGLSTGGQATWAIGAANPGRFNALVPMCAHQDYDDVPRLTRVPIWAFHNGGDPIVFASGSEKMVNRINAAGGRAKYTEYGKIGHNCWDKAFADEDLWKWMLAQRKRN